MIILVDGRTMGSNPSGIGMYAYNFSKALLEMTDLEFDIVIVTDVSISNEMKYFKNKNIEVLEYGEKVEKNFKLYSYFKFVQKCIHKVKPDIFWEVNEIIPIKIKNPYGKMMVTIHDLFPITSPQYFGIVYSLYFRYGISRTIKQTDIFLYNSLETKKVAESYYRQLMTKDNFVTYIIIDKIYPGNISDDGYFLYIGNLEKRKGSDLLLKAFDLYRENGGTKELHIAGKMREQEIQELYDSISKNNHSITYHGYIDEEEKKRLFGNCSCFVFPSREEGFGMPPVEAMNFYKPIIVSNLSIFTEILEDNVNYFDITGDESAQIRQLCECMFHFKKGRDEAYDSIVNKYIPSNCGENLKGFLLRYK